MGTAPAADEVEVALAGLTGLLHFDGAPKPLVVSGLGLRGEPGTVGFGDVLIVLSAWGRFLPEADLDGDGRRDVVFANPDSEAAEQLEIYRDKK